MEAISDILLIVAVICAAAYCFVLGRRLKKFSDLEQGMGGTIAILSNQVKEMSQALDRANYSSKNTALRLDEMTQRAEIAARNLELHMASLHDLPISAEEKATQNNSTTSKPEFVRSTRS